MKTQAHIDGLGEVMINRRKGAKNIRIRVDSDGVVKISLPWWVTKKAGVAFAIQQMNWLQGQQKIANFFAKDGTQVGRAFKLKIIESDGSRFSSVLENNLLTVKVPSSATNKQDKIKAQITTALKQMVKESVFPRLEYLAEQHSFKYKALRVKTLKSRWGSCSQEKAITLNTYLPQLPSHLIDYVLLHELMHTRHLHHGREFWHDLERILPTTKKDRKQLKNYRPHLFTG